MAVVSMNNLLEAGVHFGHQTKRWNPKMKPYIYGSRDEIYIIDLQKTAKAIEEAYAVLKEIASNGGKVIYVGTRKQAQDAVRDEAMRSESYYINERWLGGTLTNFRTIRGRVKRLEEIENMEKDGTFDLLPKKEVSGLKKEYAKLDKILCGIRSMEKLPQAMVIVDPSKEEIAIREARKLNIPVVGIVDTNCDPDMVDYVIPSNDDAIRAVKLIIGVLNNAVVEANGGKIVDYSTTNSEDSKDIMKRAVESVKRREERPKNNNFDKRFDRKRFDKKKSFRRRDRFNKDSKEEKVENTENTVKEVKATVKEAKVTEKAPEKKIVKEDLSGKTVAELRELAKTREIKGYSTMKKAELLEALK